MPAGGSVELVSYTGDNDDDDGGWADWGPVGWLNDLGDKVACGMRRAATAGSRAQVPCDANAAQSFQDLGVTVADACLTGLGGTAAGQGVGIVEGAQSVKGAAAVLKGAVSTPVGIAATCVGGAVLIELPRN